MGRRSAASFSGIGAGIEGVRCRHSIGRRPYPAEPRACRPDSRWPALQVPRRGVGKTFPREIAMPPHLHWNRGTGFQRGETGRFLDGPDCHAGRRLMAHGSSNSLEAVFPMARGLLRMPRCRSRYAPRRTPGCALRFLQATAQAPRRAVVAVPGSKELAAEGSCRKLVWCFTDRFPRSPVAAHRQGSLQRVAEPPVPVKSRAPARWVSPIRSCLDIRALPKIPP